MNKRTIYLSTYLSFLSALCFVYFYSFFPVHGLPFFCRFPPFFTLMLPALHHLPLDLFIFSLGYLFRSFFIILSRPRPAILLSLPSILCPYDTCAPPPSLTNLSIPTSSSPFTQPASQPADTPAVDWPCGSGETLISVYRELKCTLQGFRLLSDVFI